MFFHYSCSPHLRKQETFTQLRTCDNQSVATPHPPPLKQIISHAMLSSTHLLRHTMSILRSRAFFSTGPGIVGSVSAKSATTSTTLASSMTSKPTATSTLSSLYPAGAKVPASFPAFPPKAPLKPRKQPSKMQRPLGPLVRLSPTPLFFLQLSICFFSAISSYSFLFFFLPLNLLPYPHLSPLPLPLSFSSPPTLPSSPPCWPPTPRQATAP
jgi:hypothetical protein